MTQGYSYYMTVSVVEKDGDTVYLKAQYRDPMFLRLPCRYFDDGFLDMCVGRDLRQDPVLLRVHKTADGQVDFMKVGEKICFSRPREACRADLEPLSPKVPPMSVIARMLDCFMTR